MESVVYILTQLGNFLLTEQQVVIDNKFGASSYAVISSVPQGLVLGPLLFQVFIH